MKKVVVISTSLRRGSNSDMLADQFVEGAKVAGNDVEKIHSLQIFTNLTNMSINGFNSCLND